MTKDYYNIMFILLCFAKSFLVSFFKWASQFLFAPVFCGALFFCNYLGKDFFLGGGLVQYGFFCSYRIVTAVSKFVIVDLRSIIALIDSTTGRWPCHLSADS